MRRLAGFRTIVALLVTVVALLAATSAPAGAQDDNKVLKMGWHQDAQTLNPFVAQDEENFRIWAINWDLLVNFDPTDLSPVPGIAESWRSRPTRRRSPSSWSKDAKWSDGQPITSKDVKYSLDARSDSLIFTGYTSNVTSIETPDDNTVVIKTKQPDARIIGGLFIYIIPEHVYGKVPLKTLTKSSSRRSRWSAAAPTW